MPTPPSGLFAASLILSSSVTFRRIVPFPEPVLTVTVRVAPEPVTPVMDAPVTPMVVRKKSSKGALVFTPVTDLLKVTVKLTLAAPVGLELARSILITLGGGVVVGLLVGVLVAVEVNVGVGVKVGEGVRV